MTNAEMRLRLLELEEEEEAEGARAEPVQPRKPPKVGPKETTLSSFADTVPGGKTVAAASGTAGMQFLKALGMFDSGVKFTPQGEANMRAAGHDIDQETVPGWVETYGDASRTIRERTAEGKKQNPLSGMLGTGLGIGASIALPSAGVLRGTSLLGRLGNAALTGGAYGGIAGAEGSGGEVAHGDFGQIASDALGAEGMKEAYGLAKNQSYGSALLRLLGSGALGGASSGLLAGGVVEGAKKLGAAEATKAYAIRKGKDVLQGGSDIAAPGRKPLSDAAVEEVLESKLMGGTTAETYGRIEGKASEVGDLYGKIVTDLEAMGVQGPNVRKLADELFDQYAHHWPRSPSNKAVPNSFLDEAMNVEAIAQGKPTLGLSQTEDLKRAMQHQARLHRLTNNPTEEAMEEIASRVRQANEDAITAAGSAGGKGSAVADLADRFVPTKQKLGRLLEARMAAERGATKAAARSSGPGLMDVVIGSTTGNPAAAYMTAMASKSLRSRLPSIASRGSYGASEALRTGSASPALAKYLALAQGEPDESDGKQQIIDALMRPR